MQLLLTIPKAASGRTHTLEC